MQERLLRREVAVSKAAGEGYSVEVSWSRHHRHRMQYTASRS